LSFRGQKEKSAEGGGQNAGLEIAAHFQDETTTKTNQTNNNQMVRKRGKSICFHFPSSFVF